MVQAIPELFDSQACFVTSQNAPYGGMLWLGLHALCVPRN